MRILEKPIATAGLGVACAIALLFVLSYTGPFFANTSLQPSAGPSYTSNISNQNSETSTVSSVSMASGTNSASYYINGTPSQQLTVITTTTSVVTVSSTVTEANSVSASPLFAFSPDRLSASVHGSAEFFTLAVLAILSLVIALGSMYFVKRKSVGSAPEIETSPS